MGRKPVVRREAAQHDIETAALHYLDEGGEALALRFIDAVEDAVHRIEAHPAAGSSRYAQLLELEALRFWPVKRFPYLIFYVEGAERVDVLRVLHGQRDLPAWLQAEEDTL